VEHECEALGGIEHLEHDEQREPDRVCELELGLRIDRACALGDRPDVLAPRLARAQHVEAHARDHGGQPAARIRDVGRVGALELEPGLLHRVVGLGERAEHPIRDAAQVRSMFFEIHGHILHSGGVNQMTLGTKPM